MIAYSNLRGSIKSSLSVVGSECFKLPESRIKHSQKLNSRKRATGETIPKVLVLGAIILK
jgi:hypothetical protein